MNLQFEQKNGMYEAEFAVSDAFNLNLVRENKGQISIFQKGASDGEYPIKASYRDIKAASVVDVDVTAVAYPKYIKIVSSSPVVKGTITTDGEAIEIPSSSGGSSNADNPLDYPRIVEIVAYGYDDSVLATQIYYSDGSSEGSIFRTRPSRVVATAKYLKDGQYIKYTPYSVSILDCAPSQYWQFGHDKLHFEFTDDTFIGHYPSAVWDSGSDTAFPIKIDGIECLSYISEK